MIVVGDSTCPRKLPVLRTPLPRLTLNPLTVADAGTYYDLIMRNREHLTRNGDYEEVKTATPESVTEYFTSPPDRTIKYGVRECDRLIGRVDLNPANPPRYSIGYWLDEAATGQGYMTAACSALINFACTTLGATDIFAGVTHGNSKSVAVLERLGFSPAAEFEHYTRFHLPLS
ncbi:GNAT family N-acetyltransferase [Nonomuraea sp. B19D2]|uniref:GNAT family N-acetyltransferase n=1 Tax=Nonomuraea sp. B19D2 TaxID=3159561 RepID=UPI0032DA60F5